MNIRVICCVCKQLIREKEPLKDHRETHTYCPTCFVKHSSKNGFTIEEIKEIVDESDDLNFTEDEIRRIIQQESKSTQ